MIQAEILEYLLPRGCVEPFVSVPAIDNNPEETYYSLVRTINISYFKSHISAELRSVREGQKLIILDRDIPVAEVVPFLPAEEALVGRTQTRELTFKKLDLRVERDPLEFLMEDRGVR